MSVTQQTPHRVPADTPAFLEIVKRTWGHSNVPGCSLVMSDGQLDRKALGALVFDHAPSRRALNRSASAAFSPFPPTSASSIVPHTQHNPRENCRQNNPGDFAEFRVWCYGQCCGVRRPVAVRVKTALPVRLQRCGCLQRRSAAAAALHAARRLDPRASALAVAKAGA